MAACGLRIALWRFEPWKEYTPLLSLERIKSILQTHREEMGQHFFVKEIGVFGSYVRGEAREGSDIDLLVEFSQPVDFTEFLELEERLQEWPGAKVDLVTK